jgi:hypothetical protein
MRNRAVFGIFRNGAHVDAGVSSLIEAGFPREDISVLMAENVGTKDFAHEKHSKAPEGATAGAAAGAVIGGTLGLLAGVGALPIPALGMFVVAGPIFGALAGVGSGGVAGGLIGAAIGLGIPEFEAKRYAGILKNGGILLSVHCENGDWAALAKEALEEAGARDIATTDEPAAAFVADSRPNLLTAPHSR